MVLPQEFLKFLDNDLVKTSAFTSFPLSILLIPLEALIDKDVSCPCDAEQNAHLINLILIAPFIFVLGLMCILQLIKDGPPRSHWQFKHFLFTLIPPFVWIMLVLLDGDYVACQRTDWSGVYVSDDQQHVKWCQPTEPVPGKNDTELQALTISFIASSQIWGFVMLLGLGLIIIIVVVPCVYCCNGEEPLQTTEDRGEYMGTFACYISEANLPLQFECE